MNGEGSDGCIVISLYYSYFSARTKTSPAIHITRVKSDIFRQRVNSVIHLQTVKIKI